jgi:hypothetical protein
MKKPGPVGLVVLLAFAVPVIIELRTVLVLIGIDIPGIVFFPGAALLIGLGLAVVYLRPDEDGSGKCSERLAKFVK